MNVIKKIGKGLALVISVLTLIYLTIGYTLSSLFEAENTEDLKLFAYELLGDYWFLAILVIALIITLAISVPPRRWWQWLFLGVFLLNVFVIAFLWLWLPTPQPVTGKEMEQYYVTHKGDFQRLIDYIKLETPDSLLFDNRIYEYEIDNDGRFVYMKAQSCEFDNYDFYHINDKKVEADYDEDVICSFTIDTYQCSTRDEQVADSMLMILGIDKTRLLTLMNQAGVKHFEAGNEQYHPIRLLYRRYSSDRIYWFELYNGRMDPLTLNEKLLLGRDIILNDSVVFNCGSHGVLFHAPFGSTFIDKRYSSLDFRDIEDYQKNKSR